VRNKYREDLLRQIGVEHFIDPNDEDWLEKVTALTYNGQGVDHAIKCSGAPFYQEKLMAAVRLYGTVNFSGHIPGKSLNIVPLEHIINPMHTLMGQHDVRMRDREGLVRALCNREVWTLDKSKIHTSDGGSRGDFSARTHYL
jgi:propanol-preferring alcohol dehydrogenase